MTNADKFKAIFGLYATELWAKPEKDFLEWLNADAELFGISEQLDCSDCVNHGGDWDCDHVQCRKGADTISRWAAVHGKDHVADPNKMVEDLISRRAAIDELVRWEKIPGYNDGERSMMACAIRMLSSLPSAQQNCDGCKWSDAIGYGECHHCKRAYDDMYEKGAQP